MKTFDDLKFGRHPIGRGIQAKLDFPNGYSVSVIQGDAFYTEGSHEYELAILRNGDLCYDTPITDDVLGHLSSDEVTKVMRQVQELK